MRKKYLYIITISLIILLNLLTIPNCKSKTLPDENVTLSECDESTYSENTVIRIVAMGDVCFARNPMPELNESGENVFKNIKGAFRDADIVFGNLECVLCDKTLTEADKSPNGGPYNFRQDTSIVWMLRDAGVDIVSLANNHTMDYGEEGLFEMMNVLDEEGIKYFGAGKDLNSASQPVYFEVKGTRLAFIGANEIFPFSFFADDDKAGCNSINTDRILSLIEIAEDKADFICLSLHWGLEGNSYITSRQERLAHTFIDAGVDIIFGHHPHVLQKTEIYNGGLILYSMGNFVFNTSISERHNSALFVVDISKSEGVIDYYLLPIRLDRNGVPSFTDDESIVQYVNRFW